MVYFDDSIRSASDVQRYLELPLLGLVPRVSARTVPSAPPPPRLPEPELSKPVAPPTTAARR
jgi:hypothetical protein